MILFLLWNEENMAFSFPRDPSVTSNSIPVIVNVEFISLESAMQAKINYARFLVAEKIRSTMSLLTGGRDVIVVIRTALQIAAVAVT